MCSVEGFTGKHDFTIEEYSKFNENRGPDGTTYYKDNYINLGHSLLSISPNESPLRQPWKMSDGNYLVWNGEIFGLEDGQFDTSWLAETIVNRSLGDLKYRHNWMGAGAIYDLKNLTITLFRDHFGVKPMYYMEMDGDFFFSSTARPLMAVINQKRPDEGITRDEKTWKTFQKNDRHLFGRYTQMERIRRLAPGQILKYDLRQTKFIENDSFWGQNWTLHSNMMWTPKEMEDLFVQDFNQVCHAPGVKKTISMSGGLDSTLIASLTKDQDEIDVQSVKYDDFSNEEDTVNTNMLDEYEIAKAAAEDMGIDFNTTFIPYDHPELVSKGQFALSLPQWDRNRWTARYANIEAAKERGSKIYIVGDGADELLTGYNGDYDYFGRRKGRPAMNQETLEYYAAHDSKWGELKSSMPPNIFGHDLINNRLFVRAMQHVDSFCTTVDHLCGNFGMESRMPFLSQTLAKYLLQIPSAYKLHVPFDIEEEERNYLMGHYKGLIRDHMRHHLPEIVTERRTKIGFATPWNARDNKMNIDLAEADWKIFQSQANKYFKFGVDFNNELEDNDILKSENNDG